MTTQTLKADDLVGDDVHRIDEEAIEELRSDLFRWQINQFPDRQGFHLTEDLRLGIIEEMGELAHAILKRRQMIRGMEDDQKFNAKRDDAIGDAIVYFSQLQKCNQDDWGITLGAQEVGNGKWHEEAQSTIFWLMQQDDMVADDSVRIRKQNKLEFSEFVSYVATFARVSEAHAKLCFVETAKKVLKRTARTESREPV
jgi:NTP pyrophosphatase (non-canonical NTP hydrolase)